MNRGNTDSEGQLPTPEIPDWVKQAVPGETDEGRPNPEASPLIGDPRLTPESIVALDKIGRHGKWSKKARDIVEIDLDSFYEMDEDTLNLVKKGLLHIRNVEPMLPRQIRKPAIETYVQLREHGGDTKKADDPPASSESENGVSNDEVVNDVLAVRNKEFGAGALYTHSRGHSAGIELVDSLMIELNPKVYKGVLKNGQIKTDKFNELLELSSEEFIKNPQKYYRFMCTIIDLADFSFDKNDPSPTLGSYLDTLVTSLHKSIQRVEFPTNTVGKVDLQKNASLDPTIKSLFGLFKNIGTKSTRESIIYAEEKKDQSIEKTRERASVIVLDTAFSGIINALKLSENLDNDTLKKLFETYIAPYMDRTHPPLVREYIHNVISMAKPGLEKRGLLVAS